ncbi:hypothetical protein ABFY48_16990 [Lysinibacillus pakistanensis]
MSTKKSGRNYDEVKLISRKMNKGWKSNHLLIEVFFIEQIMDVFS